ncbi:MAG TPA: PAS domain S-box protein [Casimicrobiaceae bacterium]|nr:PAS domain S-box protein [Casimicrobiaceae bacterium]
MEVPAAAFDISREGAGGASPHEHFVQFYETEPALVESIADFVGTGLSAGAAAIVIATQPHLAQLDERCSARGIDLASARGEGRYVVRDARTSVESLLVEGWPDAGRFTATLEPLVAAAARRGSRVVIFGEMVALLWNDGRHDAAVQLEQLWNELAQRYAFSLFCAYPIAQMQSGPWPAMHAVCAAHSNTIPTHATRYADEEKRLSELCDLQRQARALEHEIGQRRATENLLASRERELADILENAAQAIHSVGPDGVILWANQCELDMLGYAASEYVGHPIADFYVDASVAARILRRLGAGESLRDEPVQMRHRNGSVRDVLVTSNVRFEHGAFAQTRCFSRDVTEQRCVERALRESEEHAQHTRSLLASIVESSDDAIISKSLDGRITSWNASARRVFGYTAEEAVGKPITMIIPPEHQHEERLILERLGRGERIEHFETVRVAKDGRRIDVSLTISPVRDQRGRVVGASKVARDVSERKRMEERLRDADRRKDEFIAMLGHELRNPLAPIRNVAALLRRTTAGDSASAELCLMLERQVQQMTRLLDDLLDVNRITRGNIRFQRELLDLATVVQHAVEASGPIIDRRGHRLHVDLPAEPLRVNGDAARLVQMLTNLLNNAAKYTPDGGRIELAVARRDASLELRVKDNGVGIALEMLPRVFDLFVQADRSGGDVQEGLGLGLTLVRVIAEHHGGVVEAVSAGPGRGSEFIVRLPDAEASRPVDAARAQGRRSVAVDGHAARDALRPHPFG